MKRILLLSTFCISIILASSYESCSVGKHDILASIRDGSFSFENLNNSSCNGDLDMFDLLEHCINSDNLSAFSLLLNGVFSKGAATFLDEFKDKLLDLSNPKIHQFITLISEKNLSRATLTWLFTKSILHYNSEIMVYVINLLRLKGLDDLDQRVQALLIDHVASIGDYRVFMLLMDFFNFDIETECFGYLMTAAHNGHLHFIKSVLDELCVGNANNSRRFQHAIEAAFLEAVTSGHLNLIKYFLQDNPIFPSLLNKDGLLIELASVIAVFNEDINTVKLLMPLHITLHDRQLPVALVESWAKLYHCLPVQERLKDLQQTQKITDKLPTIVMAAATTGNWKITRYTTSSLKIDQYSTKKLFEMFYPLDSHHRLVLRNIAKEASDENWELVHHEWFRTDYRNYKMHRLLLRLGLVGHLNALIAKRHVDIMVLIKEAIKSGQTEIFKYLLSIHFAADKTPLPASLAKPIVMHLNHEIIPTISQYFYSVEEVLLQTSLMLRDETYSLKLLETTEFDIDTLGSAFKVAKRSGCEKFMIALLERGIKPSKSLLADSIQMNRLYLIKSLIEGGRVKELSRQEYHCAIMFGNEQVFDFVHEHACKSFHKGFNRAMVSAAKHGNANAVRRILETKKVKFGYFWRAIEHAIELPTEDTLVTLLSRPESLGCFEPGLVLYECIKKGFYESFLILFNGHNIFVEQCHTMFLATLQKPDTRFFSLLYSYLYIDKMPIGDEELNLPRMICFMCGQFGNIRATSFLVDQFDRFALKHVIEGAEQSRQTDYLDWVRSKFH